MIDIVGAFIAGIAVGLFLYRLPLTHVIDRFPNTLCDYYEFERKKSRHERDGQRDYFLGVGSGNPRRHARRHAPCP